MDSVSAWRAVRPATGKPAHSDAEISGDLEAVTLPLTTANSASPPPFYHNKMSCIIRHIFSLMIQINIGIYKLAKSS